MQVEIITRFLTGIETNGTIGHIMMMRPFEINPTRTYHMEPRGLLPHVTMRDIRGNHLFAGKYTDNGKAIALAYLSSLGGFWCGPILSR